MEESQENGIWWMKVRTKQHPAAFSAALSAGGVFWNHTVCFSVEKKHIHISQKCPLFLKSDLKKNPDSNILCSGVFGFFFPFVSGVTMFKYFLFRSRK